MQNISDYFSQLSQRDKGLITIAAVLIGFAMTKVFVFDALDKSYDNLQKRNVYVAQQTESLLSLKNSNSVNVAALLASDQIINSHLKDKGITDKLKQIRTTSSGEKRFEIESIQFDEIIDLLNVLNNNGSTLSSIQIKNRNTPGVVNIVMTLPN